VSLEWSSIRITVKGEPDPNHEDDRGGQMVRVGVETMRIVKGLPEYR